MNSKDELESGTLHDILVSNGELKETIITYVGNKLNPKNDEVTVGMVVEVLASEFPEIVLALAEENYIRGYAQGVEDATAAANNPNWTLPGASQNDK
jgi:hypothetical protein